MPEPRLRDRNRVLTVPNVLSVIRLVLVPVFLWLLLVEHADAWATGILMFTGASDWADGKIARLMNQSSRLGELLDPAVDRIYMITIPIAFALRHFVPWWFVIVLIARDAILAATLPALRSRGLTSLPVTYIGKGIHDLGVCALFVELRAVHGPVRAGAAAAAEGERSRRQHCWRHLPPAERRDDRG